MAATGIFRKIHPVTSPDALFFLIFLAAILLRLLFLDYKLFHHDEAIHAWFSYELLTKGTYVYDPMYHGPLLYYATAWIFSLLGQSDAAGRLLPALAGTAIVPLVYAIYRLGYLDRRQALVATLFVAVSPDLVYFSRFLRHDSFQLFFSLLLLVALLAYLERGKTVYAIVAGLAAGAGMCLKEDMPLFLVVLAVFGIYLALRRDITFPRAWKRDGAIGALVALGVISLFYSSFGAHPEVLWTGAQKAYAHWTAMHGQCRICGPWFFYVLIFLLYEVPIFVLAIFSIVQFAGRHNPVAWIAGRARGILRGGGAGESGEPGHPWNRQEIFSLFCIFWFVSALAAYAYIGEKVPWLVVHQLLPAILVSVYMMTKKKAVIALSGCAFLVLMTLHVSFAPGDVNEPIVQVQNSEDLRTVMRLIDASGSVVIASENYWPLPWYYRGEKWNKMHFYGRLVDEETIYGVDPDMVITHDQASYPSLSGYTKETYRLCYWFSIYDNENRIPEYYVKRDGKLGSINIDVFVKPGLYERAGIPPPD